MISVQGRSQQLLSSAAVPACSMCPWGPREGRVDLEGQVVEAPRQAAILGPMSSDSPVGFCAYSNVSAPAV